MKQYLQQILIIVIGIISIFSGCSIATSGGIDIETEKTILTPGSEIELTIKIMQSIENFRGIEMDVNYDDNVIDSFEVSTIDSFKENTNSIYFNYIDQHFNLLLKEPVNLKEGDEILKIRIKINDNLDFETIPLESYITLSYVSMIDAYSKEYWFDGEVSKYTFTITDKKAENLSLSTTKYKIGEGDTEEQIRNYQKGDRFITQIEPNTTMQEFKSYLTSNGEITLYNEDGTPITDNDTIIQTGMKLKVTKENCEDIDLELALIGEEPLYLSTTTYQIGEGDTEELLRNYQLGDKFITKVAPNTKIKDFINNLITNGDIEINYTEITLVDSICPVYTTTIYYDSKYPDLQQNEEIVITGMTLQVRKEGFDTIELTIIVEDDEEEQPLYLLTNKYKIGEQSPNKYEQGEKFITEIPANTSISDFIANLTTNGNISVYNAGEEVTESVEEQVVTGMKLKVSKEGHDDIELEIIVDDEETPLYLLTSFYKIGTGDTSRYEEGDEDISGIPANTSISNFIANLTTNGNISVYNAKNEEVTESVEEIVVTGMKLKVSKEGCDDIELEIKVEGQEKPEDPAKLSLTTTKYKIGNQNQTTYELGDTCISKIPSNTSISEFIAGLTTNGNISVYNAGEEVTELEDELVGTGMKLKVSKEGSEDIELVISVIGDTSGDGLVQPDDLADTVQAALRQLELTEAQFKAVDMDEDGEITPADLADEVQLSF